MAVIYKDKCLSRSYIYGRNLENIIKIFFIVQ